MKKTMKKTMKIIGLVLVAILVSSCLLPYAIPLSKAQDLSSLTPFENSSYITIRDTTLHYRLFLPETSIPRGKILFVHGLGGSTYSYEKIAPVLAEKGFLVVAIDLPLFGYSERIDDFNHSQRNRGVILWEFLHFIDIRIEAAGRIQQGWHLAGHSMGGGTVAAMASMREDKTASLILIDGALFENSRNSGLLTFFPPVVRWLQIILERSIIKEKNIRSFLESAYGKEPTEADVAGYYQPLSQPGTARAVKAFLKTSSNLPIEELKGMFIPVLAIWGEEDTWVPVSDIERIQAIFPQMVVKIIPGAGHVPMETHPEEFTAFLLEFLFSLPVND
jgi:2-hydroxy-6-oxonona-2,4-dienedioate hydrolase